jgi:hypothetical protein
MPVLMPIGQGTVNAIPLPKGRPLANAWKRITLNISIRRTASTYYVTETLNQFLAVNNIGENFPIICLEKWHCKNYKTGLMNGTLARRSRRNPGPVTALPHLICGQVVSRL